VVSADVWGRADRADPVALRLPGHADRVVEVAGAVVESREQVAVEVDRGRLIRSGGYRGGRPELGTARCATAGW
jgi:hypothetical protein